MFSYGKIGLNDKYYIYKAIKNDRYKTREITPIGFLYAKDVISESQQEQRVGNSYDNYNRLTIITNTVHKLEVGDYLINRKTGDEWRIAAIPSIDDDNEAKKYSMRPPKWTTLSLEK